MRLISVFVVLFLSASAAVAAPCGPYINAACGVLCASADSYSCSARFENTCVPVPPNGIRCGPWRTLITCTCVYNQTPSTPYMPPDLNIPDDGGFFISCDNGVGVDEETGDAYCLEPEG